MGHGDTPIPVEITPGGDLEWELEIKSKSEDPRVVSQSFEDSLMGRTFRPERLSGKVSHSDYTTEIIGNPDDGWTEQQREVPFERKSESFIVTQLDKNWEGSTRTHPLEEGEP